MKKMKRVFCGALAGVMLLALAACGTTDGNSANTSPSPSASGSGGDTAGATVLRGTCTCCLCTARSSAGVLPQRCMPVPRRGPGNAARAPSRQKSASRQGPFLKSRAFALRRCRRAGPEGWSLSTASCASRSAERAGNTGPPPGAPGPDSALLDAPETPGLHCLALRGIKEAAAVRGGGCGLPCAG